MVQDKWNSIKIVRIVSATHRLKIRVINWRGTDPCVAMSICDQSSCTYAVVEQWAGVSQCNEDEVATNAYVHYWEVAVPTGTCFSASTNTTTLSMEYLCVVDATYGNSGALNVWYNSDCSGAPYGTVPVFETGCELQNASAANILCNQGIGTTTTPMNGCDVAFPQYLSDGWCDDQSGAYNTAPCAYDGGDCCEETCVNSSNICGSNGYACINPSIVATNSPHNMSGCNVASLDWINDGYCDDYGGYNTAPCFYDGGDCCEETCVNSSSVCGTNG
eukprot:1006181_1